MLQSSCHNHHVTIIMLQSSCHTHHVYNHHVYNHHVTIIMSQSSCYNYHVTIIMSQSSCLQSSCYNHHVTITTLQFHVTIIMLQSSYHNNHACHNHHSYRSVSEAASIYGSERVHPPSWYFTTSYPLSQCPFKAYHTLISPSQPLATLQLVNWSGNIMHVIMLSFCWRYPPMHTYQIEFSRKWKLLPVL